MNIRPEIRSKTFYLAFNDRWFRKGDIIIREFENSPSIKVKVIKTYPFNWWRKFLFWLGIPIKSCKVIKVKET